MEYKSVVIKLHNYIDISTAIFLVDKSIGADASVNRDEKSQLLIGVRRANRQQTTLPSSVLSADSMHIGVLAAAAHAAANHSPFTVFYNPRQSVVPYFDFSLFNMVASKVYYP